MRPQSQRPESQDFTLRRLQGEALPSRAGQVGARGLGGWAGARPGVGAERGWVPRVGTGSLAAPSSLAVASWLGRGHPMLWSKTTRMGCCPCPRRPGPGAEPSPSLKRRGRCGGGDPPTTPPVLPFATDPGGCRPRGAFGRPYAVRVGVPGRRAGAPGQSTGWPRPRSRPGPHRPPKARTLRKSQTALTMLPCPQSRQVGGDPVLRVPTSCRLGGRPPKVVLKASSWPHVAQQGGGAAAARPGQN